MSANLSTLLARAEHYTLGWPGTVNAALADAFSILERRYDERVVTIYTSMARHSIWGAQVRPFGGQESALLVGEDGHIIRVTWTR